MLTSNNNHGIIIIVSNRQHQKIGGLKMANKGRAIEEQTAKYFQQFDTVELKKADNSTITFKVSDRVLTGGYTTRAKWDIVLNPAVRLQVKSTNSNRASVVNMVPVRNLLKMSKREMIDVQPALDIINLMSETGKAVKLAEVSSIDDWRDLLTYLLFEGTPTAQEIPTMQANYLLEVSPAGYTIVEKSKAIDYIFNSLVAEIRTRKDKKEPCLHIRYGK